MTNLCTKKQHRASKSNRLLALSAAAVALPGISVSVHGAAPTESTLSYRYTNYSEGNLRDNEVANEAPGSSPQGTTERYDIDVHQLSISGPIGAHFAYGVNFQDETLSGASPWDTELAENNTVDIVMSGASIEEHRTDLSGSLGYYYQGGSVTGSLGMSTEDDYDSISFGVSTEREFDNKQTVLGLGASYSDDTIDPEDEAVLYNRVNTIVPGTTESKQTQSFYVSVSRVVSPSTQILGGISYTQKSGHLHDPYKRVDTRPDKRNQMTLNFSARQYVKDAKAALHLDYRYYDDDWGVDSHTITGSVYKTLDKLQVIPFVRYYIQSAATFYKPYQPTGEDGAPIEYNYFSNDARLSEYDALSGGVRLVLKMKPIDWLFTFETYAADQGGSSGDSNKLANPGIIKYSRVSIGLDYRF